MEQKALAHGDGRVGQQEVTLLLGFYAFGDDGQPQRRAQRLYGAQDQLIAWQLLDGLHKRTVDLELIHRQDSKFR